MHRLARSALTWTKANSGLTDPLQYVFGYDAVDQLNSASLTDTVTSATVRQLAYRYDSAGNRVTNQDGNTVITETPNSLNQLTQTASGGMMHFAGTLSKPGTVTVGGNPATVNSDNTFSGYATVPAGTTTPVHIVATDGDGNVTDNYTNITPNMVTAQAFAYDLNGNTTSSGPTGAPTATYNWDAADRLTSVTQGATVTTYDYDGLGRRVREWVNGTETRQWIWDGLQLCEERDASNTVTKRFYAQGEQIAGVAYYATFDHLGSIQEMLDNTGSLSAGGLHSRYTYDLYGQRSANLVTVNAVASDFGFTGYQEFDSIGLLGAPLRFYQPAFERWLSRDPIEESGGINLYQYAFNNPGVNIDPLGLANQPPFPYHPPTGTPLKCRSCDSCPEIMAKCGVLATMISTHMVWDFVMPAPRGGGRHIDEIADLWRAYSNCQSLFFSKNCGGAPPPVSLPNPVPVPMRPRVSFQGFVPASGGWGLAGTRGGMFANQGLSAGVGIATAGIIVLGAAAAATAGAPAGL